jgi:hypothetical protein
MNGNMENRLIKMEANISKKLGRATDDLKDTLGEILKKVDKK